MMSAVLQNLEKLLASGREDALLYYAIGNEYLKQNNFSVARSHFENSLKFDPGYTAAWKLLGKACQGEGDHEAAILHFQKGMEVAQARGDVQAGKEMQVFLKRSQKQLAT